MKSDLKQPCSQCPFRKVAPPGWLGPHTLIDILDMAEHGPFPCHMTVPSDTGVIEEDNEIFDHLQGCAGAAIFLNNRIKLSRRPDTVALQRKLGTSPDVFGSRTELIEHHATDDLLETRQRELRRQQNDRINRQASKR